MKHDKFGDIVQVSSKKQNSQKGENNKVISNARKIASQCYATLMLDLLKLSIGGYFGMTTFLVAELSKENAEISVTIDELSWYGSYCFMTPVGIVLGGLIAQCIGSRIAFIISTILVIVASLIFHWATNAAMLLCGQAIIGAVYGLHLGPGYAYLAEVSEPHIRSTLLSSLNMALIIGTFIVSLLGNFFYWRTLTLMLMIFPILAFGMLLFVPESPHWLANKNRYREAELSLAWYRGWSTTELTQTEFDSEFDNQRKPSSLSKASDQNTEVSKGKSRLKQALDPYLQKAFYLPLITMFYMHLCLSLCGTDTMQSYAMWIFRNINSPISEHIATTILFAVRTAGAIFCMFSISIFGKRKLMFLSLGGATSMLATVAVFNYLADYKELNSEVYLWIPTISLIIAMFMFASGIDKIPYIINSEIFPTHLRQVSNGIGHLMGSLFLASVDQSFLYAVGAITLPGVLLAFSIANFIGLIVVYFVLPETEGKTLKEIEEHYKNTNKS